MKPRSAGYIHVGRLMIVTRRPSRNFYYALIPPALFALDMVWESTWLSWGSGPQMVGFALMHTVGIILFPALLASLIWAASTIVVPIFARKLNLGNIAGAIVIVALLGIASLSYGFWVKMFATRIASGPHAAEFLVYMSHLGELSAVQALVEAGVPVNAGNRDGKRAIDLAKTPDLRAYLRAKDGAGNRLQNEGTTPNPSVNADAAR